MGSILCYGHDIPDSPNISNILKTESSFNDKNICSSIACILQDITLTYYNIIICNDVLDLIVQFSFSNKYNYYLHHCFRYNICSIFIPIDKIINNKDLCKLQYIHEGLKYIHIYKTTVGDIFRIMFIYSIESNILCPGKAYILLNDANIIISGSLDCGEKIIVIV